MAKTITVSEARDTIGQVLEEAHYAHRRFIVTRRGRPYAVILGVDEYNNLMSTLEEMADPGAVKALKESEADYKAGKIYSFDETFGYIPKQKSKKIR
ncbi:MAG: type II toxin-antitoxin system Phd/YefM family antitoxin [Actinobacteria bacterium]|nr:type II toxin-antitoxin system Phd/YefM family antitoxin [Actinomycetota bacterium]